MLERGISNALDLHIFYVKRGGSFIRKMTHQLDETPLNDYVSTVFYRYSVNMNAK